MPSFSIIVTQSIDLQLYPDSITWHTSFTCSSFICPFFSTQRLQETKNFGTPPQPQCKPTIKWNIQNSNSKLVEYTRTQPTDTNWTGLVGDHGDWNGNQGLAWVCTRSSASMIWCYCGNWCFSDSSSCNWDPFPPIAMPCPVLICLYLVLMHLVMVYLIDIPESPDLFWREMEEEQI